MRIIIADVETTGLGPDDRMVEVAWCEVEEDLNVLYEYQTLINPEIEVPCEVAALHGIRTEDVYDAPLVQDVPWPDGEIMLVSHNVQFDKRFLDPFMDVKRTCCTLSLAKRFLPEAPNYKLGTLACYIGQPKSLQHRAYTDVRSCLGLLDYFCEGSGMDVFNLSAYLDKRVFVNKVMFGQHKGMLLSDLPPSYVRWLMKQSLDEDLRYSLNRVWGCE